MSTPAFTRIALTVGDPHGIGPEIALKALALLDAKELAQITLFGPLDVLRSTAIKTGHQSVLAKVDGIEAGTLPTLAAPGKIDPAAGRSAIESATAAIEACRSGHYDCVVAGPHHETAIAQAGIAFSGYPSLVESVCGMDSGSVFLMLVGAGLKIVHVTLHESVDTALARLNTDLVVAAAQAGVSACLRLGDMAPKIGIFGINPHASEGTLFGAHDLACTVPAAERLRQSGLTVSPPAGADVLLSEHASRPHGLYVAMFHDQGHIPIKLLAPHAASAFSIGANVLLTTTGHGCAMDIAGTGKAQPDALLRSLKTVLKMTPTPQKTTS